MTNLRKAGNDYTTIMKASGHKTMSMFLRYNLVNEEDVAGIKWKDYGHGNPVHQWVITRYRLESRCRLGISFARKR